MPSRAHAGLAGMSVPASGVGAAQSAPLGYAVVCGIAGIAGPHDQELLERLAASMEHRGPDGGGVYRDPEAGVGLVARRLVSIP